MTCAGPRNERRRWSRPPGQHLFDRPGWSRAVANLRALDEEPSIGEFLKGIPAPGKTTLLHTTQRWIKTGKELEAIEHRRDDLAAKEKTAPVTRATIAAARSQWFRVVSAVLSNLELSDAPAEAIETIRGPVLKASERAGKRYGGAPAGEGPGLVEPGEPAVGETEEEAGAGDGELVS
ncbi:hypothetical protein ACMHYB_49425 [Sorangium sp. So ce1128]